MSTPHYVATRVGDQFVLVPAGPMGAAVLVQPGLLAGAAGLTVAGLVGRGLTRWILLGLATGVGVAWFATTRSAQARREKSGRSTAAITHGPSFPRDQSNRLAMTARVHQRPEDAVDEASMESFPASDPPAHTTPSGSR